MKGKFFSLVLSILLIICTVVKAEETLPVTENSKEDDIRTLLEMTETAKLGQQMMNQVVMALHQQNSSIPDEFFEKFLEYVDMNEIVDLIVPVYDKNYTHDEIKGLIEFYSSPLGRKVIQTMPNVMQESMMAGQQWGRKMAQQMVKKLQEEGY